MNKTAIKNFAIWARRKLISDITYKAGMLGITESGIAQPLPQSTRDLQFFDIGTRDYAEVRGIAIEQRNGLVKAIQAKEQGSDYKTAFRNVIEEVAYTWFNRLIAVRFMEVNDYLPSHIRVLSSENEGKLEPDFVTTPFDTGLDFSAYEKDLIYQLKDENKLDELFRFLFIKQCNALNEILPGLFEAILDYTELLLNISFTDKDGIVYHLTHDISEDEFDVEKEGQVEIIGWMYQYYNTEPKDEVFALLKKNIKITKERIPAATQLFTPDWIVRYMVENSLGRLWVEGHPNEQIKTNWKYYLEEAEQEPDVVEQLNKIREEYAKLNPTDIKVIDPCMGSGHILVYAFDVLMQIYTSQGYIEREAAKSILQNNLFGIDIDARAYQLAYFAVMMKARQYNRRIFQENITPNLIAIKNPADVSKIVLKRLGGLEPLGLRLVEDFEDAEEYGSILQVNYTEDELQRLEKKIEEIEQEAQYGNLLAQMEAAECVRMVRPLIKQARLLAQKYDIVVTNPPYMGNKGINLKLSTLIAHDYENYKADLFSVFIMRGQKYCNAKGFMGFLTPYVWMFIQSYEKLRDSIYTTMNIENLIQFEYSAFEEATVPICTMVLRNTLITKKGSYIRLTDFRGGMEVQRTRALEAISDHKCGFYFEQDHTAYMSIPGCPVAFWASDNLLSAFRNGEALGKLAEPRSGLSTTDNARFLRFWFEVMYDSIAFDEEDTLLTENRNEVWYPIAKGGDYRKWYGNNEYVVKWYHNGKEIKEHVVNNPKDPNTTSWSRRIFNYSYYFHPCVTWSGISSGDLSVRKANNQIFGAGGKALFSDRDLNFYCALLNSKTTLNFLTFISPTLNFESGHIAKIPVINPASKDERIQCITNDCCDIAKKDWDSFETSWDFEKHPLIPRLPLGSRTTFIDNNGQLNNLTCTSWRLEDCYDIWADECQRRFAKLKANEEELNQIFIDIYGLQDEMTPGVDDKGVSVRKADQRRDICSFISYAVGCIFGRYSLDVEGLAYAGGKWDATKYITFIPDEDNCIPITDEEYFSDDIVGRFVEFVRVVYGTDTLEENLDFIAATLGNKGNTSREVIRNYFLNDFYKDHMKIYQKRPIYWLFDSGKQNGFKALVYMHRWNADTVGNLRIEYLHKLQTVYEHEIDTCQEMIDHGTGRDVAAAEKRKEKLIKQFKECKDYDALVAHIAFSKIDIDLDDGVKVNYRKVQTGADGKFCEILANFKDIMVKEK